MIHKFKTKETDIGFDFDVEFEPNQKIHCIIGKNGIGKTQLLENMAKSLVIKHSIFFKDGLFHHKNIYEKLKDIELKVPLEIEINNILIKDKKSEPWVYTKFEFINSIVNKNLTCDKPIIFIGAKNRGFTKNIDPDNIKILANSEGRFVESIKRTTKYINGEGLENEEVANWFVSRVIVNPNFVVAKQNKMNEVETVLRLIEKLEPSLELLIENKDGSVTLDMSYNEGELLINNIPLNRLSTGFVSIIKIFQEIVAGYGGWSNIDDLNSVDGIVFIDEIEPHLHISWQTKILNILRDFFPNTTFYISTHSPLVLAGLKENEAYELYHEDKIVKTKKIKNIDNYFLGDIVRKFFGVDLNMDKLEALENDSEEDKRAKSGQEFLNFIENMED